MERTVFPDHVKVEEDGGRSLSSIPPERITLVRSALESSNETPVAIPGCQWQWPFDSFIGAEHVFRQISLWQM